MPHKKYYWSTKRFKILDNLDKAEIIFKALSRFESGTTAYEIGRKAGCAPDTARKYLNFFHNKGLVKRWKVGRYILFAPKKKPLNKNFYIRTYLENVFKD